MEDFHTYNKQEECIDREKLIRLFLSTNINF